ncbi:hypothetical protein [Vibrio astriarenae]|uniref:hypothetical protein n=1 Tax=Vibrio astriarenae TaxID=1481923 RepID=UPI0037359D73
MTPAMRGFIAAFDTPLHYERALPGSKLSQETMLWLIVKAKRAQPLGYVLAAWVMTDNISAATQSQIKQALATQEYPEQWVTLELNLFFSHLELLMQREEHTNDE